MTSPPPVKLRAIPSEKWSDWYRGNKNVAWDIQGKGRDIEMFATSCPCGQWWGWTPILEQIVKVRDAMARLGCPKCKKTSRSRSRRP